MTLLELTDKIRALDQPDLNKVFLEDIHNQDVFQRMLKRARDLETLALCYYQRAGLYLSERNYRAAALDYYQSASLNNTKSIEMFSHYHAKDIDLIINTPTFNGAEKRISAEEHFVLFIQYSTGLGRLKDSRQALLHLAHSAHAGYPETAFLCRMGSELKVSVNFYSGTKTTTFTETIRTQGHLTLANYRAETESPDTNWLNEHLWVVNYQESITEYQTAALLAGIGFLGLACMYWNKTERNEIKAFHYLALAYERGEVSESKVAEFNLNRYSDDHPESTIKLLKELSTTGLMASKGFKQMLEAINISPWNDFNFFSARGYYNPALARVVNHMLEICNNAQQDHRANMNLNS